ncbi:hypothetical protein HDV63DRAFT_172691 [Trichoderma sp. SZMC 28014]
MMRPQTAKAIQRWEARLQHRLERRCGMRARGGSFSAAQAASQRDGIANAEQCGAAALDAMQCDEMRCSWMQLEMALENAASDESGRNAFRHDGKEEAPPKKKGGRNIFWRERMRKDDGWSETGTSTVDSLRRAKGRQRQRRGLWLAGGGWMRGRRSGRYLQEQDN